MKNTLRVLIATLGLAAVTTNAQKVTTIHEVDFDNFTSSWSSPLRMSQ
jgi:hypothetical protein